MLDSRAEAGSAHSGCCPDPDVRTPPRSRDRRPPCGALPRRAREPGGEAAALTPMSSLLPPPYCASEGIDASLRVEGYAIVAPAVLQQALATDAGEFAALLPYWERLPPDTYLRDGGRYRRRRHACCLVEGATITPVPHRAHWQPLDYNALHGGIERWFEPIEAGMLAQPLWSRLLRWLAARADALHGAQRWHVEMHPFRIDTTDGIGRPTPEGAHRDGVDLVAVLLVARHAIKGGETRVFEAEGPRGLRFTMQAPWTLLLLDDHRVIHESTPIQPDGDDAHRDTLVITLRARGFQDAPG
jgi:hypothetical protein